MTPILIGAGQSQLPIATDLSTAPSHADLAGLAAKAALADAGVSGAQIDVVASVRTFSDSSPAYASPFGGPRAMPLAVAERVGATPRRAVYDVLGGQSPQTLVGEFARELMAEQAEVVLIAGGEALANQIAAKRAGATPDWREDQPGEWEDRGPFAGPMIMSPSELAHGLMDAMGYYGFIETARRMAAGRTVAAHRKYMAELIAPMLQVAAENPYSMFDAVPTAVEIAAPSAENRPLVSPYLKAMVAKDGVNQGAAVVMTTVGTAQRLGVPESKWIYLRGHAEGSEALMLDRAELGHSVALDAVMEAALRAADTTPDEIDHADIYSCFPCVVDQTAELLNRRDKPMTLTGGLPFFGGPGNNYTLHGICEVIRACRAAPGSVGLAHGNGGWMSKQAAGIYSNAYVGTDVFADSDLIASKIAAQDAPGEAASVSGEGWIESHIVRHRRGAPVSATLIVRLNAGGRCYAQIQGMEADGLAALADGQMDKARVRVEAGLPANKAWILN